MRSSTPLFLLLSLQLQAGSQERAVTFFDTHREAAQQLEYCNGIPAQLSLAVWALESGYGTSKAAQGNNLGGIASYKGGSKHWAKFTTLEEFYTAYAAIFNQPCYSNDLQPKTVDEYLEAMEWGCCSYHRSERYTRKIKWIIEHFKLDQVELIEKIDKDLKSSFVNDLESTGIDTTLFYGFDFPFNYTKIGSEFYLSYLYFAKDAQLGTVNTKECVRQCKIHFKYTMDIEFDDLFKLVKKYSFKEIYNIDHVNKKILGKRKIRLYDVQIQNQRTGSIIKIKEEFLSDFIYFYFKEF